MKSQSHDSNRYRARIVAASGLLLTAGLPSQAQFVGGRLQVPASPNQVAQSAQRDATASPQERAEEELRKGTALTRAGSFSEAIPHLLAARGRVLNTYAANFNLALCYVGTGQFEQGIEVLHGLRVAGHDSVDVENLLAQAYIGNAQAQEALASLRKASALSPQNEKLYAFVADACMDHRDYILGLTVVGIGLRNLPRSSRLYYERALFLIQLDDLDKAKRDFERASQLAPGSEIAYLAAAHQELIGGNIPQAIETAREGVNKGYENHALLTVLAEALIRSGVGPGQPDFVEAQTILEKAVMQQPNDAASQIGLGSLYLMAGRLEEAIAHLEQARQLEPGTPSVYANLAKAYQRRGRVQQAGDALTVLQKLNQEQADKISSAPGNRKSAYASQGVVEEGAALPHK
ncbi:MAG TPA: tetratricopeptide repeat protein [Candidatus Polarisedimenticolia bacterium]|nr:tetratricopeptide repeat protein [Candidatus Polarisedimenticolia bacterium]